MVDNVKDSFARELIGMLPDGIDITDNSGNILQKAVVDTKTNHIKLKSSWLGGSSGGNIGGETDPNHPTVGADYYPGSVYDGTISGRTLLFSGVTSTTDTTNIVFPESVGAGLRLLGDGIQYRVSMDKTLITRGVKGDTTNIPLVYDVKDQKIAGSYVTISPLPISNKKEDLISGSELVTPFNGVGEGDGSAEIKVPEIHVQYDSKTNSINITNVQGYALDNLSDTKTGTLYDVKITLINSFYVQDAVSGLPDSMSMFTGDTNDEVILNGTNSFFDNIEGIRIDFDSYMYFDDTRRIAGGGTKEMGISFRIDIGNFNIPKYIILSKEDLIVGLSNQLSTKILASFSDIPVQYPVSISPGTWRSSNYSGVTSVHNATTPVTISQPSIKIGTGSIQSMLSLRFINGDETYDGQLKITSVKTAQGGK